MILKLKRGTGVKAFMNRDILYVNFKQISLDRVLTNLFSKLYANGAPVTMMYRKEHTVDSLKNMLEVCETNGTFKGIKDNEEGVEDWLRSSLLELINRGNIIKEHVSTLKPLHLLSFRIQNSKFCRDYYASDQLYLMLKSNPAVLEGLTNYLRKGWDKTSKNIVLSEDLDVDTLGILYLTNGLKERNGLNATTVSTPLPFLPEQSALFNDDIRRLLVYKDKLPRTIFIDYLRILCGLHLALYTMKVVYLLPKMIEAGTRNIEDDWSMVVDVTDNLDSQMAPYACKDVEQLENAFGTYIRSTYMVDLVQERKHCDIDAALSYLKDENNLSGEYYESELNKIRRELPETSDKEFDQDDLDEMLEFFPEDDYFDKLLHLLEKSNLGAGQRKYLVGFLDSASMKNTSSMLMADSRSKRHPRRLALGSKLLETLVQLLVLKDNGKGGYTTRSLSVDELADVIRQRYGLIINGIGEPRFADADVALNAAFHNNTEAFKDKLRQIGFYTDMSDACILQKIHPRYKLED